MDQLLHAFDNAATWPRCLFSHQSYEHALQECEKRLDEHEDDLFCLERKVNVGFLQYNHSGLGFWSHEVKSLPELQKHFCIRAIGPQRHDPKCQYIFIHAPHSRAELNVTKEVLLSILAYHQVMPGFMDLIFPFGSSDDARDYFFSGFKHETQLMHNGPTLAIPELGRSGQRLQMCYSFRSPAKTRAFHNWEWSVKQTAVYHSFDLETGRSVWILVKGDPEVKKQVDSTIKSNNFGNLRGFADRNESFSTSLATHEMFTDWAGENWRWYLNYLEIKVQELTERTLTDTVEKDTLTELRSPRPMSRSQTGLRSSTWRSLPRSLSFKTFRSMSWKPQATPKAPSSPIQTFSGRAVPPGTPNGGALKSPAQGLAGSTSQTPPANAGMRSPPAVLPPDADKKRDPGAFDIEDIRRIERVEEKANEALLIIKTQIGVLNELRSYYEDILELDNVPADMAQKCKGSRIRFRGTISSAIAHLNIHNARIETLLKLLADRKSLLSGIIEYQSMEASKLLAIRARESSIEMEAMTKRMETIAEQTQKETVSMRVITVITLIFLPGTFVSTLLSTDIVKFQDNPPGPIYRVFSTEALSLFASICFPIMFVTIVLWLTYTGLVWRRRKAKDDAAGDTNEKV